MGRSQPNRYSLSVASPTMATTDASRQITREGRTPAFDIHTAAPARTNTAAVLAFIEARPGIGALTGPMSNAQPMRTRAPPPAASSPATCGTRAAYTNRFSDGAALLA